MAFVLKQRETLEIEIGNNDDQLVLLMKKPQVEDILTIYENHISFLKEANEAMSRGERNVTLPVSLLRDLKKLVLEHTFNWKNVVDEQGNIISFDKAILEEIVEYDISIYMNILRSISKICSTDSLDSSEKNSMTSSPSAKVH